MCYVHAGIMCVSLLCFPCHHWCTVPPPLYVLFVHSHCVFLISSSIKKLLHSLNFVVMPDWETEGRDGEGFYEMFYLFIYFALCLWYLNSLVMDMELEGGWWGIHGGQRWPRVDKAKLLNTIVFNSIRLWSFFLHCFDYPPNPSVNHQSRHHIPYSWCVRWKVALDLICFPPWKADGCDGCLSKDNTHTLPHQMYFFKIQGINRISRWEGLSLQLIIYELFCFLWRISFVSNHLALLLDTLWLNVFYCKVLLLHRLSR